MTRKTRPQLSHQRDIIMSDTAQTSSQSGSPIPSDDPQRTLTVANPDAPAMRHISVAGDTYTILVSGAQSDGRYCLIDMHVPTGGGPPPHRHDFEEMFTLLEGELEFTFRGEKSTAWAGSTVNIPANAPHAFKNVSDTPARMLCMCTPAGHGAPAEARQGCDRRAAKKGGRAPGEVSHRDGRAMVLTSIGSDARGPCPTTQD